MKMMCNCCNGANGECNCKHHKIAKMIMGVILLAAAIILYMKNYGYMGDTFLCGPSTDMWSWILPLVVGAIGLKMLVLGCMHMMHAKKMNGMDKSMGTNDKKDDMK